MGMYSNQPYALVIATKSVWNLVKNHQKINDSQWVIADPEIHMPSPEHTGYMIPYGEHEDVVDIIDDIIRGDEAIADAADDFVRSLGRKS
jgi:hypothetical protein